ncbi:hypothetical protein [Roseobacter weihaiensis]|uniref:hypothetical protein n=1 Tax=Roseobacter weihaiensis TaxID=2763262 RepID=UPI001D0A11BD|nr:hypothetical protein [Roseobacter sp. H9]
MTIGEELAALRHRYPGCFVVAFADLSTGMVLAVSTLEKTAQEKLDALGRTAQSCLLGQGASAVAQVLGAGARNSPTMALQAGAHDIRCFLRAPAPAVEALCLVLTPEADLDRLLPDATEALLRLTVEA